MSALSKSRQVRIAALEKFAFIRVIRGLNLRLRRSRSGNPWLNQRSKNLEKKVKKKLVRLLNLK
jgi:hypothetical protein